MFKHKEKQYQKILELLRIFDKSVWYWVLSNPVKFDEPILNVKGKLSLWDYPINEK
jgi:hypothetical protein